MYWLCGNLLCLDAHLPRPGWRGEDLGLPTGQGTLTALRTGEGGRRRKMGGEEVEIFNNNKKSLIYDYSYFPTIVKT